MTPAAQSPGRRWLALGLWTLVVFSAVPFANDFQAWLGALFGDRALFFGLVAVLILTVAATVRWLKAHRRGRFLPCLLWLAAISILIGWWGWQLRDAAGAGHLLAFSVLSALAFRALAPGMRDAGTYLAATALTAAVGIVDECLQWLSPERFWDLADLGVNAGVGALIQLLIWKGIRPESLAAGVSARSWRTVGRWLAAAVLLLAVCLVNTPARIAGYSERIPGLGYLGQDRKTQMIEYGHGLADPEIGRFRSRLSREELARQDRERGAEAGRILHRHRRPERHTELAKTYPPWRDPLVFEFREHLTERNRRHRQARAGGEDETVRRHATAAFREQLILERYFGRTLEAFGDGLKPASRDWLQARQQADAPYESPVGAGLETRFSKAGALGLSIAVLVLLAVADRLAARRIAG